MKDMRFCIFLSILAIIAASCSKTQHCTQTGAYVSFVGFDTSEIDEVTVVSYLQDGRFANALDTTHIDLHVDARHDTTNGPHIAPGQDYIITLQPAGRIWAISGIRYQDNTKDVPHDKDYFLRCSLSGYTVDGKESNYPPTVNQLFDKIYLVR